MKPQLTPLEKEHNSIRKNLQAQCNRIEMKVQFKQVTTWPEVYAYATIPPVQRTDTVTIPAVKEYFKWLKEQLEITLAAKSREVLQVPQVTETVTKAQPLQTISLETPSLAPAILEKVDAVEELSSSNSYGLIPSPNEKAFFYWFQKKAITEAIHGITVKKYPSMLLLSGTGSGKTYMCGGIVRRLVDSNYHVGKTFGIVNYLYVTRATIVEQTKRVFRDTFNLGIKDAVEVLNIEQLRSRAGSMWVNEHSSIVNGEEVFNWKWKAGISPCVVIWDECQALKNTTSTQHKIAAALNELPGVVQLFVSATPFTRVAEAKCFAVATHKDITSVMGYETKISNENWMTYAAAVGKDDPLEYNEAAVERLINDLEPYIIRVKGIRPQFDAINKVEMIRFATTEERKYYETAYTRYLTEKAKKEVEKLKGGEDAESAGISILVEFLKFRMAAEFCRKDYLAKRMHETVTKDGKAAVCALNFKGTIIEIVKLLVDVYGVPRSRIALVWGGGQTQLTAKQKAKQKIKEQAAKLEAVGLSSDELLESLDLDEVEDRILQDLPEHLRLGPQSKEERQKEIDKFQSGKADYCLFTFRAGGVGLSLHHTDELSPIKVRHKDSGYAIEEDIKNVPVKPRRLFAAPTYSAIEIVQGLGRCPRLTSLSDTEQFLVFYAGTIEQDVADVVSKKLRCLSKVVKTREKWSDIVTNGVSSAAHLKDMPSDDDVDSASGMLDSNDDEE